MTIRVYRADEAGLASLPVDAQSLDDATLQTGHGVYSVFRLYPGRKALRLGHHLARMRRSADGLNMSYTVTDAWLRDMLRAAVIESGVDVPRVRITVPYTAPDTAIIAIEPFFPPPESFYREGVKAGLAGMSRQKPGIKDSRFIVDRRKLMADNPDMYEILLHDDEGRILEGSSSNFYAVLNGTLHTTGKGMLEGIARSLLLQVAPAVLPVELEPISVDDLPRITEAMITSSSRAVVPVVSIGGNPVGEGVPGPVTGALLARYNAQVDSELEAL